MILKEVLHTVTFLDVWSYILKEYKDHDNDNSKISYFEVFEELKTLEPTNSDVKIKIYHHDDVGWCIDGVNEESTWAIEFRPWNEWLGMEIEEVTSNQYEPYEIIAHCLWEMTFVSFDNEEIQSEWENLGKTVKELKEDLKNGTAILKPIEELEEYENE